MFNSLVNMFKNLSGSNKTNTSTVSTIGNNSASQTLSDAINSANSSKNYGMSPLTPNQSKLSFSQYSSANKVSPLTPAQYASQGKTAPYNTATAPTTNAGYNSTIANAYKTAYPTTPASTSTPVVSSTPSNNGGTLSSNYNSGNNVYVPQSNVQANTGSVSNNYGTVANAGNTPANANTVIDKSNPNYNTITKTLTPNMEMNTADSGTIANAYKTINLNNDYTDPINSLAEKQLQDYLSQLKDSSNIDENTIRSQFKQRIQDQIDAINNAYATLEAKSSTNTTKNLGVAKAINARSGLLGSDFSSADETNINKAGQDEYNSLEAERAGKVSALLNSADDQATKYIADKRTMAENATNSIMQNILTRETRTAGTASKLAVYLASKGVKGLEDISPDDLKTIEQNYGVDKLTLQKAITDNNSALTKDRYVSIGDGAVLYDKVTGQQIENPKSSASTSTTYTPGANPVVDAFASQVKNGTMTITNVPAEYRGLVAVATQNQTTPQDAKGASDKLNMLINTINEARKMSNATSQGSISQGWQKLFNGVSDRDRLDSYTNTLKTNILQMFTDPTVRKFFGPQMSNADVQMMMSVGTPLSVNMTPAQFNSELDNLEIRIRKALQDGQSIDTSSYQDNNTDSGYNAIANAFSNW